MQVLFIHNNKGVLRHPPPPQLEGWREDDTDGPNVSHNVNLKVSLPNAYHYKRVQVCIV